MGGTFSVNIFLTELLPIFPQIKSSELFDEWVSKLRHHRVFRQNEIITCPNEKSFFYSLYPSPNSPGIVEGASMRRVKLNSTQPAAPNVFSVNSVLYLPSVSLLFHHIEMEVYSFWGWTFCLFSPAGLVHSKAVLSASFRSIPNKLQQPGQGSCLAPVFWRHGKMLQRWQRRLTSLIFMCLFIYFSF